MAPRPTRTGRKQFSAYIDEDLFEAVDAIWHERAGMTKRDVIEMLVNLGVDAYKALPEDHRGGQQDLLRAG